jgi:NADH:ubiquinone oxidoreductase subunit C
MTRDEVIQKLAEKFRDPVDSINTMPVDEKVISIAIESFREIITWLQKETPFSHLTTITALDTEAGITLLYHFWYKQGLSIRVVLPDGVKCIPSLVEQLPGAAYYEREVAEMYGLDFEGHADLLPLFKDQPAKNTGESKRG